MRQLASAKELALVLRLCQKSKRVQERLGVGDIFSGRKFLVS